MDQDNTNPRNLCYMQRNMLLPSATKLLRLCFYRRVSVHRGGLIWSPAGGEGVCSREVSAPGGVCSVGGVCSGGCLLCTEAAPPGRDDYCCGRYASYWNAFLYSFTLEATCDKNTGKYRQAHTVFSSQSIDFLHTMRKRNDGARYPGKTYIVSKITMVLLYLHGTQL